MGDFSVSSNQSSLQRIIQPAFRGFKSLLNKVTRREDEESFTFQTSNKEAAFTGTPSTPISPENEWKIQMLTRWKQMDELSQETIENLYIYVPIEEVSVFRELIENYQIQAVICPTYNAA